MYRIPEQSTRRSTGAPRGTRGEGKRASGSQSLERGLDILEMIEAESGDIGVRELARRVGLSPTIVQRLVSSLSARGYIEKNPETARYRLGHRSMILGASGERGVDYAFMLPGLELATQMVLELCGGTPSEVVLAGDPTPAHA